MLRCKFCARWEVALIVKIIGNERYEGKNLKKADFLPGICQESDCLAVNWYEREDLIRANFPPVTARPELRDRSILKYRDIEDPEDKEVMESSENKNRLKDSRC